MGLVKRHDLVKKLYRDDRYMQHLDKNALDQRFFDVVTNLLLLDNSAKISLPEIDVEGERWIQLWTHVLEEYGLRFGPFPCGLPRGSDGPSIFPFLAPDSHKTAAAVVREQSTSVSGCWFKFGRREHLQAAVDSGQLRVSPASFYSDPSLNSAARDDELHFSITPPPHRVTVVMPDRQQVRVKSATITSAVRTDFHLFCLSASFAPRFFLDFRADTCLVVRDRARFLRRVADAYRRAHAPDHEFKAAMVQYVDPLNCSRDDVVLPFCKHFRYAYQRELRLVWIPKTYVERLDHVHLEMEPLSDIAELIPLQ